MSLTDSVERARGPAQTRPGSRPQSVKPRLTQYVGQPCPYCTDRLTADGDSQVTRDHILPRVRMKKFERARRVRLEEMNCLTVCKACNAEKGSQTLYSYLLFVTRRDPVRANVLRRLLSTLRSRFSAMDFLALTGAPR